MKKILFVCPYPLGLVPSQRFRFEQYLSHLQQNGFHIVIKPFFSKETYSELYQSGNLFAKMHAITRSYFRRLLLLSQTASFDFIFLHREATPVGPPLFEYIVAKVQKKKIIYDFDDAIWLTDKSDESPVMKFFRWRKKVASICKWSHRVSCGNSYLATYAKQFNPAVILNPTTIDTVNLHSPARMHTFKNVTIGWTGSHSTLKYLETVLPVLQSLEEKYPMTNFLVIADSDPRLPLKKYQFLPWNIETEIADLSKIDIGIMPMPADPWTMGKCGFKAMQYMAMSVPAVVSPVGINKEIVEHGIEGFLCTTYDDWFRCLEELITDSKKRSEMGGHGRKKIIDHYSVISNLLNFLSLFK